MRSSDQVMQLPCDEVLQSCCPSGHDRAAPDCAPAEQEGLHRALLCCGIRADEEQIASSLLTLNLQSPCSASDVRMLAVHLFNNGCQTCRPVVPHCHRGMLLRDLCKMDDVLIGAGWLKEQCAEYNLAEDVQTSRLRPLREDLYGLDKLLVRDATSGHIPDRLVPLLSSLGVSSEHSEEACSFAELLSPMGLKEVHFFVSHYWGHPFTATVAALSEFAANRECAARVGDAATFWICAFCLNQHMITAELGDSPDDAPFNIALAKVKHGVVMVLDEALNPFRRIWCLYEVSRANDLGRNLCILTAHCSQDVCLAHDLNMSASKISHKLREVCALEALASSENDKLAILHRIMDVSQRRRFSDLATFIYRFKNPTSHLARIDSRSFQDFDNRVRELLATPLFHAELQQGRLEEAMQYAVLSDFSVADLQRLIELKGDITSRLPGLLYGELATLTLLHKAVRKGSDTVRYLIDLRADIESPLESIHVPGEGIIADLQDHSTPLHAACMFSNLAAVKILVDARANVLAESSFKMPPIHCVARGGREINSLDIAKILVGARAEVFCVDRGKNSLMHVVACKPDTCLMDFVLQQGHPVNIMDVDGATPLHVASNWGMVGQIHQMCNFKADVSARKLDGATPLHRAARSGHVEAAKALLLHKASPDAIDSSGHSPLQVALESGHHSLAELMQMQIAVEP